MSYCVVGVILPAAGCGVRFGGPKGVSHKQYLRILGKPLFQYALEAFCEMPCVLKIALVVDNTAAVEGMLNEYNTWPGKVLIVQGENTRHRSIRAGLLALQADDSSRDIRVVVVHDAVRPIVPEDLVLEIISQAKIHKAAGLYMPLVSTVIKQDASGFLVNALERNKYVASETPQAFQLDVLSSAYDKSSEKDLQDGTECLALVQKYMGINARLILGHPDLWKVTYRKDAFTAIGSLRDHNTEVCIIAKTISDSMLLLNVALKSKVSRVQCLSYDLEDPDDFSEDKFTSAVVFTTLEIDQEEKLLYTLSLLDRRPGLVVIVKENPADSPINFSPYGLQTFEIRWKSLNKGFAVVNCKICSDKNRLMDLLSSLIVSDPFTFSGQTFFI